MNGPVGAVVVRYRGGDEVARCLASLRDHGGLRLRRTILVDSGSGDGGEKRLAETFPEVTVVSLEENRSFARAANEGAARLDAAYLLLLNPDAEVMAGCVDRLAGILDERPDVAGAVPLLVAPDGSLQHRWQLRCLPGAARLALGLPGASAFREPPAEVTAVAQPAASCWLVRRSVWEALGGLDEVFAPAWWEDVDLCHRLRRGLRRGDLPARQGFVVVPQATARHIGGSSTAAIGDEAFLTAYFTNLAVYVRRYHTAGAGLVLASLRLSLLARAVVRSRQRAVYARLARGLGRQRRPGEGRSGEPPERPGQIH